MYTLKNINVSLLLIKYILFPWLFVIFYNFQNERLVRKYKNN